MKSIQYGNPGPPLRVIPVRPIVPADSTTVEIRPDIAADLSPDDVLTALLVDTRGFPNASVRDRFVCEFFRNSCALPCFLSLSLSFFPQNPMCKFVLPVLQLKQYKIATYVCVKWTKSFKFLLKLIVFIYQFLYNSSALKLHMSVYMCVCVCVTNAHFSPRGWALVKNIIELYSKTRFSYLMYSDRLYPWDRYLYGTRSKDGGVVSTGHFPYWSSLSRLSSLALGLRAKGKNPKKDSMKSSAHLPRSYPRTLTSAKKTIPIVAPEYIRRLPSLRK